MTATMALPQTQPHSDWLAKLRTVGLGLGGRGVVGMGLGRSAVSAAVGPWWLAGGAPTPVAVYQPKGAASLAASYVNLVNPGTYDAAPGVAPTFDAATGWGMNGSTQYLITGITIPANGWCAMVRVADCTQAYASAFGDRTNGSARFYIWPNSINAGGNSMYAYASKETQGATGTNVVTGVQAITPTTGYKNGVPVSSFSSTWSGSTGVLFLGARNFGGSPGQFLNGKILAFAIWATSTDHATWMPQVMAAVAAL